MNDNLFPRSFRLPEEVEREQVLEKIKPLIQRLLRLTRNADQIKVDNRILQLSAYFIKAAEECGISVSGESQLKIEPPWYQVFVISDRRSVVEFDLESEEGHKMSMRGRCVTNIKEVKISLSIECATDFENFREPDSASVLLLIDELSEEGITVDMIDSSGATLTAMHPTPEGEAIEVLSKGGFFVVGVDIVDSLDEPEGGKKEKMEQTARRIKGIADRFASSGLFQAGEITVVHTDPEGNLIRENEIISGREAVSRFMYS